MKTTPRARFATRIARALMLAMCGAVLTFGVATSTAGADDYERAKLGFQTAYEAALIKLANAKARVAASEKALRKARQRDRLKGEARGEIYAEIEAARLELESAELEAARIPEDARRAGVPPGWLREVEERQAGQG